MERKIEVSSINSSKIVKITSKYPHLTSPNAECQFLDLYSKYIRTKDKLYDKRDEVRALEKELSVLESQVKEESQFFDIEFEKNVKTITTCNSNLTINGDLVYKYKH